MRRCIYAALHQMRKQHFRIPVTRTHNARLSACRLSDADVRRSSRLISYFIRVQYFDLSQWREGHGFGVAQCEFRIFALTFVCKKKSCHVWYERTSSSVFNERVVLHIVSKRSPYTFNMLSLNIIVLPKRNLNHLHLICTLLKKIV